VISPVQEITKQKIPHHLDRSFQSFDLARNYEIINQEIDWNSYSLGLYIAEFRGGQHVLPSIAGEWSAIKKTTTFVRVPEIQWLSSKANTVEVAIETDGPLYQGNPSDLHPVKTEGHPFTGWNPLASSVNIELQFPNEVSTNLQGRYQKGLVQADGMNLRLNPDGSISGTMTQANGSIAKISGIALASQDIWICSTSGIDSKRIIVTRRTP
jgi:hypothetical protein